MLKLKGDTLIEVTIAIGIFSMVAVIIVSVVNNSTSSAQVALETTLAREEIDAQAEAIRFIQSSYASSANGMTVTGDAAETQKYKELWEAIAQEAQEANDETFKDDLNSCDELYNVKDGETETVLSKQHAFIIDTKNLSSSDPDEIIFKSTGGENDNFSQTLTYPRVYYDGRGTLHAEGIYVTAFSDSGITVIDENGNSINNSVAYYDFYIRTCWYGPGADRPSTISTVIRLYNPEIGIAQQDT